MAIMFVCVFFLVVVVSVSVLLAFFMFATTASYENGNYGLGADDFVNTFSSLNKTKTNKEKK